MKKKLAIASLVVAAAVVAYLMLRGGSTPHHEKAKTSTGEASAIDQSDTSVSMMAMLNAPEGATPCETAFAAVEAEGAAIKLRGGSSVFTWVAPKAEFLASCAELSPIAQRCTMPRYRRDHTDECLANRPPAELLKKMFVAAAIAETKPEP